MPTYSHMKSAGAAESYIKTFLLTVFLSVVIVYTVFQARHLISGPQITLDKPTETIHTERIITLRGTTKNITSLSLNGREIYTDEEGRFAEPLVLENGYTIMTLHAENRYGRTVDVSRSFIYQEAIN